MQLGRHSSKLGTLLVAVMLAAAGAPAAGQTSSPVQQPTNYAQIIPCSALTMASASVPFDTYVIVYISSGGIVQVNSPNDPVVGIKIAPPETLRAANAYQCPQDYTAWILNGTHGRLKFNRSGLFWARVTLQSGTLLEGYIAVDVETLGDADGGNDGEGTGGGSKEIACGNPDVKAYSDGLLLGDPWGGDGTEVGSHEDVGDAVDEAYEANGDMPVSLHISAHGGPGGFKVGSDPTRGTGDGGGAQDFAGEIAGKVSSVTVFACETASGANGQALICELEQELGVDVTGYTGTCTVPYGDETSWQSAGDAYSWEEEEQLKLRVVRPATECSIPLSWLTETPAPILVSSFLRAIGTEHSPWDVTGDGVVDFFDLSELVSKRF